MDGETRPAHRKPRQEATAQAGDRKGRPGSKEEPEEARWVIEQIQESFESRGS